MLPGDTPEVLQELRRRRQGCRSGAKRRRRRRRHKPAVPAIIIGNVRSLGNKTDKLTAPVKTQREYRQCSIFYFSETCLHSQIPDNSVEVPGYSLVRGDRDCLNSWKKKGGRLALYVSERWCNPGHVNVKEWLCTPDIELQAVGMRPYYLPREFMSTIVIAVNIPFFHLFKLFLPSSSTNFRPFESFFTFSSSFSLSRHKGIFRSTLTTGYLQGHKKS